MLLSASEKSSPLWNSPRTKGGLYSTLFSQRLSVWAASHGGRPWGRRVQSSGAGCNPRLKLGVAAADDDLTLLGTLVLTSEDGTCLRAVFI